MGEVEPRQPRPDSDRAAKIRWLSQSHLEPGMNLGKFEYLLDQHGLVDAIDWIEIPNTTLDEIIAEIQGLVQIEVDPPPSASGAYTWEPHLGESDPPEDPAI